MMLSSRLGVNLEAESVFGGGGGGGGGGQATGGGGGGGGGQVAEGSGEELGSCGIGNITSRIVSSMSVTILLWSGTGAISLFSVEAVLGLVLDLSLALDTSSMCIFDLDIAVIWVTQSSMLGATAGWGGGGGGGGGGQGPGGDRGGAGGVA